MEQMKRLNSLGQTCFLSLSRQTVDRLEDLYKKQVDASFGYLREELDDAQALFAVGDLDGLAQWNAKRAHAIVERLNSAFREQVTATLKVHDELTRSVHEQFAALSRETSALIEGLGTRLPEGVQPFTEAIGAMAVATNEAIENIARMGSKLGDELGMAIVRATEQAPKATVEASREAA